MKQYRIGIIGTENSHADSFCRAINLPGEDGKLLYPDFRVTLAYGHYPESNQAMVDKYGVLKIAESLDEMVENIDAVVITARDGKFHYEFAKPFIEAGIPAFIDKPFTVDIEEAKSLISLAKEKNVPLCGGSCVKFLDKLKNMKKEAEESEKKVLGGCVTAPLYLDSEHSGFFFYASHLAEMTMELFGYNPKSVIATLNNDCVYAVVNYDNYSVSNDFVNRSGYYAAHLYTNDGCLGGEIDIDSIIEAGDKECDAFIEMVRTGKMNNTYEELLIPVIYMNTVKEAYETGKCVEIKL